MIVEGVAGEKSDEEKVEIDEKNLSETFWRNWNDWGNFCRLGFLIF